MHRTITRVATALGAMLALVLVGAPAHAADEVPDLRVTSSVDKETLRLGESFTVTVTVRNAGPVTATEVYVHSEHENCIEWTSPALSEMDDYDLPPGESKVFTRSGKVTQCGFDRGNVEAFYFIRGKNEPINGYNFTTARVRVLGGKAAWSFSASGTAWMSSREVGVPGVTATIYDEFGGEDLQTAELTTQTDGMSDGVVLGAGDYHVIYTAPRNWELIGPERVDFTIRPGQDVKAEIRLQATGPSTEPGGEPSEEPSGEPTTAPTGAPPVPGAGGGDGDGLPVTGVHAAVTGGVGVALLVVGGLAFALTRRRRARFVAGD